MHADFSFQSWNYSSDSDTTTTTSNRTLELKFKMHHQQHNKNSNNRINSKVFKFKMSSIILGIIIILQNLLIGSCLSSNVLIIHPLYSGSHVLTLRSVAESLTQRGHQVHIVRWRDMHSFPSVNNPNISESLLSLDNHQGYWNFLTKEKNAAFKMPYEILWNSGLSYKSIIEAGSEAFPLMETQCSSLLSNKELFSLLKVKQFELAIVDILYNECALVLLHLLGIKSIVGYWAFPFASGEADYTTAFLPSSHVPAFMSRLTDHMSFQQRLYNNLMKMGSHLTMQIQCHYISRAVQRHIPGGPNPCDLIGEVNGMLINTDYSMDYPRLLPPTFINVGGMQIRKPKPLSKEIEDWMESSGSHGVVLFTMGFIFNPQVVPKHLVNAFMEAFSRLPQKFLVKFEGPIDFIPSNVKVLEWIPQQDVLAHPKTRLFLTHCGLHGVMEAIHYAVPMVGMPIFIDQGDALIKMQERGVALGIDKDNTNADDIFNKLQTVLYEPQFKRNIERLSALMRDVKQEPLERVMELLEYLIRHDGAEHLKLSSRKLNFIQYFCIDTIGFLIAICIIIFGILRKLFRKLITKTNKNSNISNNNNVGRGRDCNNNSNNSYTENKKELSPEFLNYDKRQDVCKKRA